MSDTGSSAAQAADVAVVGGGAVGMATAWQLARQYPDMRIVVLEKEPAVSQHQTGRNSGVIHSGIYYKPGSYKARNCVAGREELVAFCQEAGVLHDVCGKVIVALNDEELPRLEKIHTTGLANGLDQIKRIDAHELRQIEPHCAGIAAIWVPYTGIVDFPGVVRALASRLVAVNQHNRVLTGWPLTGIVRQAQGYVLHGTGGQTLHARYLIAAAGLQSDRVARMDGLHPASRILGFRGDYYDLTPEGCALVRNLIYPVPNPDFPFLGVHLTRMALGGVEAGPNAVFVFKREGYGRTSFSLTDTAEALGFRGTWQFFARHWRFGIDEYRRAFSKALFLKRLQRLVPGLQAAHLVRGRAGVRAMAVSPQGQMIDDFVWQRTDHSLHVLNAPSPAATACLAIGREVTRQAAEMMQLAPLTAHA